MRLSAALGPLVAVCAAACAFALPAKLPAAPDYKHLYETHQWFALRDAVNSAADHAPVFFKGAVEAAFNETEAADRDLKMDIRGEPHSTRSPSARDLLVALYYRQGRYKTALTSFDLYHYTPANDDEKKERAMLVAMAQAGDLSVSVPKQSASVAI